MKIYWLSLIVSISSPIVLQKWQVSQVHGPKWSWVSISSTRVINQSNKHNFQSQVAGAITLAVQASFEGDGVADWNKAGRRSFYFQIAWTAVLLLQFLIFYRKPGTPDEEHEAARKRIRESGKDAGVWLWTIALELSQVKLEEAPLIIAHCRR